MSKNLPPPDTGLATSILSRRFSADGGESRRNRDAPSGAHGVPVEDVAPNPFNTRDVSARPRKIEKLAASIKAVGQIQSCPVVTRDAYLRIFPSVDFPEEARSIGESPYVQVPGARRRAAVIHAGLPTINIEVKNELAESRERFLEATLAENLDREELDPIEEALAVQQMVEEAKRLLVAAGKSNRGAIAAVARKRGRSDAWVHQLLNLLALEPEVQAALRVDEDDDLPDEQPRVPRLPGREVRTWHKLDREQQLDMLTAWRRRNDPTFADDAPTATAPASKPRVSRIRAALSKLGKTPADRARAILHELDDEERQALRNELAGDS